VLCARQHLGAEPFAVLLGDDLIDEAETLLTTMMGVQQETGGSVIALIEVDPSQISAYGCADITAIEGEDFVRVNSLVEKLAVDEAPSSLAVIGRYVLHPSVFGVLENTAPGRGGEIPLTDALQTLAAGEGEGSGVFGVVFKGRRYDTGDKLSYLKAVIALASERVEFGEDLKTWLKTLVG
jgi:UTP--glucose-1-phosphate uridylyltransferase